MKVGLIRCLQTEDMCSGTVCLKMIRGKKLAFEGITDDIEVIGINTCCGCLSKKAALTAAMVKRDAGTFVLASCIFKYSYRLPVSSCTRNKRYHR